MEKKNEKYTPEFEQVLDYCEKNCLFLGEGNPNGKILIVGKEVGGDQPESVEKIIEISNKDVKRNLEAWNNPAGYDLKKLKDDIYKNHKNPTWTNYQKLTNKIIKEDLGKNYNFLDYCFMTELSQIHLPNSDYGENFQKEERQEIDRIKKDSLIEREKLLSMPFFRNFPIVILACGHYPTTEFKNYKFDIEKVFEVKWEKPTKEVGNNWYNVHYNSNNSKIVIHTRQLSNAFNANLLDEIAKEVIVFYK